MAIIAIQDVQDNVNPTKLPMPDWTHLDVQSYDIIWIPFKDIYIDDINQNQTKVESHTAEEIQTLTESFKSGVDTKEYTPAVEEYKTDGGKKWRLVYGFGRCESLRILGMTGWFFVELKGSPDAIEDVQAQENEQLPKRINKEVDMRKFLCRKVAAGLIKNTEKAIRSKFKKVYPNRDKSIMNRIVAQVMADRETPQPFILYTSQPKIDDWMEDHYIGEDFAKDGEFDPIADQYGVVVKEGYQERTFVAALKRFKEFDKKTYIIGHCGGPTAKMTLAQKRKQFVQQYKDIEYAFAHAGGKHFPVVIKGFLPQDKANENIQHLVIVN